MRATLRLSFTSLSLLVLIAALACGGDDDGGDPGDPDNVLSNAGFEDGADGWSGRAGPATVSDEQANAGSRSLVISLSATEESPANGAEFAYQDATPDQTPEYLAFDYFVDNWVQGTPKQYIEAVVIVTGSGPGMPECPGGEPCPNIQMRYVLAGVTSQPSDVLNARWRYTGEEEPVTGEWLHFDTDLRNDMTEAWGSLPSTIDSVRLQLEVRYDDKAADELDLAANVYWDNVYLGTR